MGAETGVDKLRARLLRWLGMRDRSEREIRDRLAQWGGDAEAVDQLVLEFAERGIVNDALLADKICDWHRRHDPLGPLRLMNGLRKRGIAGDLAEAAVEPYRDEELQREFMAQIRLRRLPALLSLEPERRRQRLRDHLMRRGFSPRLVDEATRDLSRPDQTTEEYD